MPYIDGLPVQKNFIYVAIRQIIYTRAIILVCTKIKGISVRRQAMADKSDKKVKKVMKYDILSCFYWFTLLTSSD